MLPGNYPIEYHAGGQFRPISLVGHGLVEEEIKQK